ncbi:MAG: TetR/AcrR family transcriptional regulator [Eubacteriales bacterium]|nr:TetR/AcrR family transcriptional regulator [Eubacteriales bacterium]
MPNKKNNVSKEAVVETAVRMIDESKGLRNVTLRVIAKEMGCAHTNLYNYFDNLDEIYWQALGNVLVKMIAFCLKDTEKQKDPGEKIFQTISNIIDFSFDHEGWYRLIWFEPLSGEPTPEVRGILFQPAEIFTRSLMEASERELSKEEADVISDIILGYLHGELSIWINHRSFIQERAEMKSKIISSIRLVYEKLMK